MSVHDNGHDVGFSDSQCLACQPIPEEMWRSDAAPVQGSDVPRFEDYTVAGSYPTRDDVDEAIRHSLSLDEKDPA